MSGISSLWLLHGHDEEARRGVAEGCVAVSETVRVGADGVKHACVLTSWLAQHCRMRGLGTGHGVRRLGGLVEY